MTPPAPTTAVRTTPAVAAATVTRPGVVTDPRRRLASLALASSLVVSFLAASIAPSPLYERYEAAWHASPLIGTIAFAVYAFAVLVGLLWLGELPAQLGRRPVLLAAIGGQIIALILFALAGSFTPILIGRVIQGLAAGAALGTLSASMIESDAERGTVASAASPGAGSASGAILSGLVVQFLPGPTHTVYLLLVLVLALQAVAVWRVIAVAPHRAITRAALRPRVAIPPGARAAFISTGPVVFAVWALAGFYAALSPALYGALSGSASVWRSTLGLLLFAGVGSATTIVLRRVSGHALTITGSLAMLAGLGFTVAAVAAGSVALYLVASVVAGVGFGAGFQGPIRSLVPLLAPAERPGVLSAVFIVAYVGMGVPAVVAGALVSGGASLTAVAVGLAIALVVLTTSALLATLRSAARTAR